MDRKCKDCVFARFEADPKTGARKWTGICTVGRQTVEQHFRCSNNRYRR